MTLAAGGGRVARAPGSDAFVIFLIDASCYVFRAYHSILPDMRDRDGNPVHAVFGFARFLGDLIERVRPAYIAVAFDERRAASYRSRIYPAYKTNRERAPLDLAAQMRCCRELCRHLGLAVFVDQEYEADDLIGTLACVMRAQGMRDGDLFWDFGARGQFGYHDIERHFGVPPECFADYLALTGDSSDNIPGVPGIGHRTAAMLMKAFGSLDELYADLGRVADLPLRGAATLGARLAAHRESVYLARRLTRIACDLSLGASASTLRRQLPDLPALGDLYDRLGFGPFLRRQAERLAQLPEVHATPSAA